MEWKQQAGLFLLFKFFIFAFLNTCTVQLIDS